MAKFIPKIVRMEDANKRERSEDRVSGIIKQQLIRLKSEIL